MKKKCMAWLLISVLCSSSIAPAYGAEFTSPSAEETEVFTAGEEEEQAVFTQGTEVVSDSEPEENLETELLAEGQEPVRLEIVQEPKYTHFGYGIQAYRHRDLCIDGMRVELYAEDGSQVGYGIFEGGATIVLQTMKA